MTETISLLPCLKACDAFLMSAKNPLAPLPESGAVYRDGAV